MSVTAEAKDWPKPLYKVFVGKEVVQPDARLRVRLPLSMIDANEREVVVTLSMHGDYLEVWPKWRYEAFYRRLWEQSSMSTPDGFLNYANREFLSELRELVENHHRVTIDESLRLTIPQALREVLGIEPGDNLVALGQVEWVEIWPEKTYSAFKQAKSVRDSSRVFRAEGRGAGEFGGDAGPAAPSV